MDTASQAYARHYRVPLVDVVSARSTYAGLRANGGCVLDEETYLNSVFYQPVAAISAGDRQEEPVALEASVSEMGEGHLLGRKTNFTRTDAPEIDDEPPDQQPEKTKLLRGVIKRFSGKGKDEDGDGSQKKLFATPVDAQKLKEMIARVQETVVPRAQQAVTTISPYIQKGAKEAFEFAKPVISKGAEMGGEALKEVMQFVLQSLLPLVTQVITDTLSQLLSALVSALISAIGSGVKSLIIAEGLDHDSAPRSVHFEGDRSGSFYESLAKLFEMADIGDVIDGRTTKPLKSGMFCVQNNSGRQDKTLVGVLWFFTNVQKWVSPADFDRLFLGELVRAQIRSGVFSEGGSPILIHAGDPISTGDLQTALQRAVLARRDAWGSEKDDEPAEPSPFDEEDDDRPLPPPPLPDREPEAPSVPAPPPPPPMTQKDAAAFYQSPPIPPPPPPRPQLPPPKAPAAAVRPPAVSVIGQSWESIEKELARYLNPREWGALDYIADPPASVVSIVKLKADPSKPQDPNLDTLLAQAANFYSTLSKDKAEREQAMQVLGVSPNTGVDNMRVIEGITSGFLADPRMIASLSDYVVSAQSQGTFSTSVLEAIIRDYQARALRDSNLGLSESDLTQLLDSYAPQTHDAAMNMLKVVLAPKNPAPPGMNVQPEAARAVVQMADTMTQYIPPPVDQSAPTPAKKPPMTRSGLGSMFGGLGKGLAGLITSTGGAFGKLATDTLTSPAIQETVMGVTKVASEAASQALVSAGTDAIREATRTKTPEEIQEAQRLRREAAEAKRVVNAEKKADREADAARKRADADAKRAKADELRKERMAQQEEKRRQQKEAAEAKKAAEAKRKADLAAAKASKAKPKPAPKPKPKSKSKKTPVTRSGNGMTPQEEDLLRSGDLQIVDADVPVSTWPIAGSMRFGEPFSPDEDDDDDFGLCIAYSHDTPTRSVHSGEAFDSLSVPRSVLAAYQDPDFHDVVQGRSRYYANGALVVWNPQLEKKPDLEQAVSDFVDDMSKGMHFGSPFDSLIRRKGAESGGAASLRAWAKWSKDDSAAPGAPGPAAAVAAFMAEAKSPKAKLMPTAIAARVTTAVHALANGVEALATIERPDAVGLNEKFPLLSNGTEVFTSMIQAVRPTMAAKASAGALFGKKASAPEKPKDADPSVLGKNVGIYLFQMADKAARSNAQTMPDELSIDAVEAALGSKWTVNDAGLAQAKRLMAMFAEVVQTFLLDPDFSKAAVDGLIRSLMTPQAMVSDQDKTEAFKARLSAGESLDNLLVDGAVDTALRAGRKFVRKHKFDAHVFIPTGAGWLMVFRNHSGYRKAHTVIDRRVPFGYDTLSSPWVLGNRDTAYFVPNENKLHAAANFWDHDEEPTGDYMHTYTRMHAERLYDGTVYVNRQ